MGIDLLITAKYGKNVEMNAIHRECDDSQINGSYEF